MHCSATRHFLRNVPLLILSSLIVRTIFEVYNLWRSSGCTFVHPITFSTKVYISSLAIRCIIHWSVALNRN
jgi:hypothetical protein